MKLLYFLRKVRAKRRYLRPLIQACRNDHVGRLKATSTGHKNIPAARRCSTYGLDVDSIAHRQLKPAHVILKVLNNLLTRQKAFWVYAGNVSPRQTGLPIRGVQ